MKFEQLPSQSPEEEHVIDNDIEALEHTDIYENEILPLIKIMKPEGISLEEYESEVMDEMYDDIIKIHASRGALYEHPAVYLEEMKEMLQSRIKAAAEDGRDYSRKEPIDTTFVRKARVALLSEGDYSDFEKYFGDSQYHKDDFSIRDAKSYLGEGVTKEELDALMNTPLRKGMVATSYYELSDSGIENIPESLLVAWANVEGTQQYMEIKYALSHAEKGQYSIDAFRTLVNKGYGRYVLDYVNKFEAIAIEELINDETVFTQYMDETLRTIHDMEDQEIKQQLLVGGLKTYLKSGRYYTFEPDIEQFGIPLTEEFKESSVEGMLKMLSRGDRNIDTLRSIMATLNIEDEILNTADGKAAGEQYIKSRIESFGNYSGALEDASIAQELFGFSDETVKAVAIESIPKVFSRIEKYAVTKFLQTYDISEELLQSPEIVQMASEAFNASIDHNMSIVDISRLVENFPSLKEKFSKNANSTDIFFEAHRKKVEARDDESNKDLKTQKLKNIQESVWVNARDERIPEVVQEKITVFGEKYGKKGVSLISLAVAAHGLEHPDALVRKMDSIEAVLDRYVPENIPTDAHLSMGIEYEVGESIARQYDNESALGYKKDINFISQAANIGKGMDGVHEIATKPTYNPYMLLAEMQLMQEAGLIDLNFEKYDQAARGYHMSIVGDGGLEVGPNIYFLNNLLTMTQLSGVVAGNEIFSTKKIHTKTFEDFEQSNQKGSRCEFKGMACDSVEQFEKAIISAHHAGVAMQLEKKYIVPKNHTYATGSSAAEFEQIIEMTGMLRQPFESDQERDILYAWAQLKNDVLKAVETHNESFIDSEFHGFVLDGEGNYIDTGEHIDIVRNKKLIDQERLATPAYKEGLHISSHGIFSEQTPQFVNALIRTNNIFLKAPEQVANKEQNSAVNARAMLDVVKEEGYGGIQEGKPTDSIFDRGGEFRDGYYVVQGASEEMITHKSQILLNRFNKAMEELLQKPGVRRPISEDNLVSA